MGPESTPSKLVLLQDGLRQRGRTKNVPGIDCIVADVLKNGSMDLVRATLKLHINNGAGTAAILRAIVTRKNTELLDGVDGGVRIDVRTPVIHHRDAIKEDLAPGVLVAVGRHGRTGGRKTNGYLGRQPSRRA